jgi:hypothetical protein
MLNSLEALGPSVSTITALFGKFQIYKTNDGPPRVLFAFPTTFKWNVPKGIPHVGAVPASLLPRYFMYLITKHYLMQTQLKQAQRTSTSPLEEELQHVTGMIEHQRSADSELHQKLQFENTRLAKISEHISTKQHDMDVLHTSLRRIYLVDIYFKALEAATQCIGSIEQAARYDRSPRLYHTASSYSHLLFPPQTRASAPVLGGG